MSDRVFSGRDVSEALALAAQALGVSADRLRYVVLEAGTAGGLGLKPTPARVAVLLAGSRGGAPPTARAPRGADDGERGGAAGGPPDRADGERGGAAGGPPDRAMDSEAIDPPLEIERVVGSLARAAGVDLRAEVSATAESMEVRICGRDVATFLLGPAEPVVLEALEHLLHGMFAHRLAPLRLRVECEGRREHREQRLRVTAQALAAEVLADGQTRTTDALNSYERRLVHMAVAEVAGVITYSIGGGPDRRVTIAPAEAPLGGEVH